MSNNNDAGCLLSTSLHAWLRLDSRVGFPSVASRGVEPYLVPPQAPYILVP
jgi:hypothetical protein